jgi:hypothetical protein
MASDELRRLLAEATPGPWRTFDMPWGTTGGTATAIKGRDDEQVCLAVPTDAALIVAAVNALPGLLDEREALREAAEEAHVWSPDHPRVTFEDCPYEPCRKRRAALSGEHSDDR